MKSKPPFSVDWPFSQSRYNLMVDKAKEFMAIRNNGFAMCDPEVNLVALEAMLLGWLYCQPWFQQYVNKWQAHNKKSNPFLTAKDKCMEACSDATLNLCKYP